MVALGPGSRLALLLAALLTWAPAQAAPLLDSRVGGPALVGPTSLHPASVYYNPAALYLNAHRWLDFFLDSTVRLEHGAIQRSPVDAKTGRPASSSGVLRFDEERLLSPFPQLFFAFSSNLGTRSVVLGLSAHTPTTHNTSLLRGDGDTWFDGAAQGPSRYHGAELTLFHVHGTLAAAYRVAQTFIIGVSTSFVHSVLDLGIVRDAALEGGTTKTADEFVALDDCGAGRCDYESDEAAEAIRVAGSGWGISFAAGVLVRPHPAVDLGLAYVSRVWGLESEELTAKGEAWVRRSRAVLANASALDVDRDLSGRGTVSYNVPDMIHFGATWRLSEQLLLNFQFRWIDLSAHDQLKIRLTGTAFNRAPLTPDRVTHHRGFVDVFAFQLASGYWLRPDRLQLQAGVMVESTAVPEESVSALAIDATKVEVFLAVAWTFSRSLTLRAGYSLAAFPAVAVDQPFLRPEAMVKCVDANYDVDLRDCQHASRGGGVASNAGEYSLLTHRLGLSLELHAQ